MANENDDRSDRKSRLELQRDREHEKEMLQIKQAYMLKKYALLILGVAGTGLLGFGATLAIDQYSSITLVMLFLMSGVMLLALGVTVATVGLNNKRDKVLHEISNKAFFDELEKR